MINLGRILRQAFYYRTSQDNLDEFFESTHEKAMRWLSFHCMRHADSRYMSGTLVLRLSKSEMEKLAQKFEGRPAFGHSDKNNLLAHYPFIRNLQSWQDLVADFSDAGINVDFDLVESKEKDIEIEVAFSSKGNAPLKFLLIDMTKPKNTTEVTAHLD